MAKTRKIVSVVFSDDEYERVAEQARAAGMKVSAYIRHKAADPPNFALSWSSSAPPDAIWLAERTSWIAQQRSQS